MKIDDEIEILQKEFLCTLFQCWFSAPAASSIQ